MNGKQMKRHDVMVNVDVFELDKELLNEFKVRKLKFERLPDINAGMPNLNVMGKRKNVESWLEYAGYEESVDFYLV